MNDVNGESTTAIKHEEELSRIELQLEHEKLKLERERILLERERLEATRDRYQTQQRWRTDANGKLAITLSNMILVAIICTLVGGILGSFSTTTHLDRRNKVRLQELMQTLTTATPIGLQNRVTNEVATAQAELPAWLKVMKPQGVHAGISLVVIQ